MLQKLGILPGEVTGYYEALYNEAVALAQRDAQRKSMNSVKEEPVRDEDVKYHIEHMLCMMTVMQIDVDDSVPEEAKLPGDI